jgi:hypothetical protein
MKGQKMATYAAVAGILAGAAAVGGGLYAHSVQPSFGIPQFFGVYSGYLSGVHVLIGIGAIMVVGGLLCFKWPSVGGIIVCAAAMVGLVFTYDRGQYRWAPMLYYWGAPWALAWLAGIFAGYAAYKNVPQSSEELADARHAEGRSA